jgi:NADPH-dependent curcumin reductase CurA
MASIRVRYITIDPMLRVWISGAKTYFDALVPGSTIPGFGIGRVIKIVDNSNRMNKPE